MKRIFVLILALILTLGLIISGCKNKQQPAAPELPLMTNTVSPTPTISATVSISPTFTCTPIATTIDDFEDGNILDNPVWGSPGYTCAGFGATAQNSLTGAGPGGGVYALALTGTAAACTATLTGYYEGDLDLFYNKGAGNTDNFSAYNQIMFKFQAITISQPVYTNFIYHVRITDSNYHAIFADFTPSGAWDNYTIPFSAFYLPLSGVGFYTVASVLSDVMVLDFQLAFTSPTQGDTAQVEYFVDEIEVSQ